MNELTKRIREGIYKSVKNIDPKEYPNIYAKSSTKEGYEALEEQIITIMIAQNIGIDAAVNLIESEEL